MENKYILKSVLGACIIYWTIGFGITLISLGYRFWGYFNALTGGIAVYFLCLSFFKTQPKKERQR